MYILSGSIKIEAGGKEIPSTSWSIDYKNSRLTLVDSTLTDTLIVSYRVAPVRPDITFRHKDRGLILDKSRADTYKPYVIGSRPSESIFDDKQLQKNGSISRGILFGNNQNLSVNSNLNLQLSGKITDRFSILASITDDNIPVQPSGNTQQLQDFDQVFIQLYDDKTRLIAGDFILKKPEGYFMTYFKRAQGAYVNTNSKIQLGKKDAQLRIEASASVSKGRFGRNVIQGIEGNQGPYRLSGTDGELFIIILAGTEQIYIDGKLLQRGQDKDYVIDYNAAEIVFTPRQFITKDRRITVEFQYSEKRYARPLLQTSVVAEQEGRRFYLNAYSENDARNQPLQQELTAEDKAILAGAGDDIFSAVRSGVDSIGYTNNFVLYALTDSLGYDSVLVYSTDSALAHYRVTFSSVGSGNGDYTEDGFTANGRKFKWIQPVVDGDEIQHQGNYAPVILLASPKKNQMISAGAEFTVKHGRVAESLIKLEGALSNRDINTFSSLNSDDDTGTAVRAQYRWQRKGEENDSTYKRLDRRYKTYTNSVSLFTGYEFTSKNFSPIERFREVEFSRNWNITQLNLLHDQHIMTAEAGLGNATYGQVSLGADAFLLGDSYTGYKGRLQTRIKTPKKFVININASALQTSGQLKSQFIRHKSDISKELGKMRVYFKDEHEYNLFYIGKSDSLAANTYQFYDWETGVGTADTSTKSITIYYRDRIDRKSQILNLTNAARAEQYGVLMTFRGKKDSRLSINLSNRKLHVINPELFTQQPENTLLGRLEYNFKWKDGFVQSNTYYEIGSGLEQKREFIYLEVPAGQGIYIWNDYDEDGVKDLQEFEIAQFAYEANYVRSSVQSNDYIRTYTNQFSQTITITPSRILKKKTKFNNIAGKFSSMTSLRADRKTTRENDTERFNPFLTAIADTSLLSINGLFRNILFFNKAHPVFGMDYTLQYNQNKSLLSNGFESRGDQYNQIGIRWTLFKEITFFSDQKLGKKTAQSDFLSGRNYNLHYFSIQPKIAWQPGTTNRFNLTGQFAKKENVSGVEMVTIQKLGLDVVFNSTEKGSLQAEVNFIRITYTGQSNTSLSFEMLEGLGNGNNFTWGATVQRTVAKNLQLNLIYNGRKPESIRTIHSGGVQLRAFF
ncbi:MAG: hypothetical protein ACKVOK_13775 [Flavobacteriales bacterium]